MWWMMSEGGGHYCSKKTDDICGDVCGQVLSISLLLSFFWIFFFEEKKGFWICMLSIHILISFQFSFPLR